MGGDRALAAIRARYAADTMVLAREAGMETARVEAAFAAVPRERYLTSPPWLLLAPGIQAPETTTDPARLYADVLVALDPEKGINNGQPSLHAAWMAGVDPQPGEAVVQIGAGAGYYTAILAELVGPTGGSRPTRSSPRWPPRRSRTWRASPRSRSMRKRGSAARFPRLTWSMYRPAPGRPRPRGCAPSGREDA